MRYVAGDDLRTLVRRETRLRPARAARIVAQVGAALDAAHAAGLVHRDVKPANVLLGPDEHAYLTDFGLTKHVLSEPGPTRNGHWVGTLDFVAPEQIRGERVDARADVYGLGCLLHYALTGRPPFARDTDEAKLWAHLSEPPPRPSEAAPDVPPELDAVVARALAKSPDERYPSAGDLGRAALAAAGGGRRPAGERMVAVGAAAPVEVETRTAALPAAPPAPRRRRVLPAAVAAAVAIAAGGRRPRACATTRASPRAPPASAAVEVGPHRRPPQRHRRGRRADLDRRLPARAPRRRRPRHRAPPRAPPPGGRHRPQRARRLGGHAVGRRLARPPPGAPRGAQRAAARQGDHAPGGGQRDRRRPRLGVGRGHAPTRARRTICCATTRPPASSGRRSRSPGASAACCAPTGRCGCWPSDPARVVRIDLQHGQAAQAAAGRRQRRRLRVRRRLAVGDAPRRRPARPGGRRLVQRGHRRGRSLPGRRRGPGQLGVGGQPRLEHGQPRRREQRPRARRDRGAAEPLRGRGGRRRRVGRRASPRAGSRRITAPAG